MKTVLYQRGLTQTTGAGLGSELVTAVNTVDKSFTAEHSFPRNVDSIPLHPTVAVFMCHSTNSMQPSATSLLPGAPPDTTGGQDAAQWHGSAGGEEEWNCGSLQRLDGLHEQTGMCMVSFPFPRPHSILKKQYGTKLSRLGSCPGEVAFFSNCIEVKKVQGSLI